MRARRSDDLHQVRAQGRLAAGQADLAEAQRDRHARHGLDLLGAQELARRQEREAFERHAVHATKVAVVGEGDAQIVDLPAPAVAWHAGIFGCGPRQVNADLRA